jgi:anti-sigma B factor antagonist
MPDAPMTFTQRPGSRDGIAILSLSGPFTLGNIFEFQRSLHDMQPQYLIFDIAQVPYMDSAGLGLLVNFYVAAQKHGRRMAVVGATQRIMALFEMTKVDSLLKLYPTVEDAENIA